MTRKLMGKFVLVGALAMSLSPWQTGRVEARPLPVTTAAAVAGDAPATKVGYYYGGYYRGGYGRGAGAVAAIAAGAIALGTIGAIAATRSPYYGYGPSYGYGYGSPYGYGHSPYYGRPYASASFGFGYGHRGYHGGYAPAYYGGYYPARRVVRRVVHYNQPYYAPRRSYYGPGAHYAPPRRAAYYGRPAYYHPTRRVVVRRAYYPAPRVVVRRSVYEPYGYRRATVVRYGSPVRYHRGWR